MSSKIQVPVLALISPAKSLKSAAELKGLPKHLPATRPAYLPKADALAALVSKLKEAEIAKIMSISGALASGVVDMFASFKASADEKQLRDQQAALLYDGPAYKGLSFETLTKAECEKAQKSLRFLSGLYGLLKPCDAIQPYRLEMSIAPKSFGLNGVKSLAEHWADDVTHDINETLGSTPGAILLNIASEEYSKAINTKLLSKNIKMVSVRFEDGGKVKSVYAKRARGLMARYVCRTSGSAGTISMDQLKQFDLEGYAFSSRASASNDSLLVFTRGVEEAKEASAKKKQKTS